jgi:hypothetical protein
MREPKAVVDEMCPGDDADVDVRLCSPLRR